MQVNILIYYMLIPIVRKNNGGLSVVPSSIHWVNRKFQEYNLIRDPEIRDTSSNSIYNIELEGTLMNFNEFWE